MPTLVEGEHPHERVTTVIAVLVAADVLIKVSTAARCRSCLLFPLLMVERDPSYSNAVIPKMLLRCLSAECPDRYRSATAVTQLDARDMPSLLFHSLHEQPWDPTQARQFARASRATGVPSKLVVLPGHLHGIDAWRTIWPTLRPWLLERLGTTDRRSR